MLPSESLRQLTAVLTLSMIFNQGCHGREKYLENEIFPGQGKVWEFDGWSGKFRKDLESQGKVRKFENKCYGRQTSENLFILFKEGKDVLSHEIV